MAARFVFLLRSLPDIDNMAPLIHGCLEGGDTVFALFDLPYAHWDDYRIRHLRGFANFRLLEPPLLASSSRFLRRASRVVWNYPLTRGLLKAARIDAVFVEWGEGVAPLPRWPLHPRWLKSRLAAPRDQLIQGCLELGLPIVCLPHGVNMKTTPASSSHIRQRMAEVGAAGIFADRNCFSTYVVNTNYFRDNLISHFGMRADVVEAWGSPRFSPRWLDVLADIVPPVDLPDAGGRKRLLFLLPKWANNVDRTATLDLVAALVRQGAMQVVVKTHPRIGEAELGSDLPGDVMTAPTFFLAPRTAETPALIARSDVVVDLGSSIALDALGRGKVMLYPRYLHENRLIFDEVGGALIAQSQAEALDQVDGLAAGRLDPPCAEAVSALLKRTVYADAEPHDVIAACRARIQQMLRRDGGAAA